VLICDTFKQKQRKENELLADQNHNINMQEQACTMQFSLVLNS